MFGQYAAAAVEHKHRSFYRGDGVRDDRLEVERPAAPSASVFVLLHRESKQTEYPNAALRTLARPLLMELTVTRPNRSGLKLLVDAALSY
jgi:hypothetical protein